MMATTPTTKTFSLKDLGLKLSTEEDAIPHLTPLNSSTDFTHVDFSGNTLGIGACAAIASALRKQTNLQVADFHDIFTSRLIEEVPPALDHLLQALLTLKELHTVDLSDNAFGLRTEKPLIDFISKHAPLRHLYLNNNGLGPFAGISIGNALVELAAVQEAAKVSGLETVVCGRNRLESGSMEAWAKALAAHKNLRTVRMVQNGIRMEGIISVLGGLAKCAELRVLDLQDNTFTESGAAALAKAIMEWTKLVELGVGDCLLSKKGGRLLVSALSAGANKELETLKLAYNEIDVKAVEKLREYLEKGGLPKLKKLDLNGNKFSEEDDVVEALRGIFIERGLDDDEGLDSLSDLEEDSDEEESEEEEKEEEEEEEKPAPKQDIVKDAKEAQEEIVPQVKDKEVDDLADALAGTKV